MFVLRCAIAIALAASPAFAQTSLGRLIGQVIDSSSATIPGADIEIRNTRTNLARQTKSDNTGAFRFEALEPGEYDISAKSTGFTTYVKRNIPVQSGNASSLNIQLDIGTAATVVEVTAGAEALLQTESVTRGGTITSQQSQDLPFSGRNPTALALTLPGVSTNRFAFGIGTFSVNGSRGRSNHFMLDGSDNNDTGIAGQAFQLRNPDAVAEVAVQTSNFDAEFGRAGGATVNTVTRAGTNTLHGSLFHLLDSTYDDDITNTNSLNPDADPSSRTEHSSSPAITNSTRHPPPVRITVSPAPPAGPPSISFSRRAATRATSPTSRELAASPPPTSSSP